MPNSDVAWLALYGIEGHELNQSAPAASHEPASEFFDLHELKGLVWRNCPAVVSAHRSEFFIPVEPPEALSSTRVMGTTSLLGQAAGTAAALCIEKGCTPSGLYPAHIRELQKRLLDADCWLPGQQREHELLARCAKVADSARVLFNGHERPRGGESNAWEAAHGTPVDLAWDRPHHLGSLRMVLDSDLNHHKRLDYRHVEGETVCPMPRALLRAFRVEVRRESGAWETVFRTDDNHERLVRLPLALEATALRLVPESSWVTNPPVSSVSMWRRMAASPRLRCRREICGASAWRPSRRKTCGRPTPNARITLTWQREIACRPRHAS